MSIKPSLSPKTKYGLVRLLAIERFIALDQPFVIDDLDDHDAEVARWGWDRELLTIIDVEPLRYEVTLLGKVLVERGLESIKELEERGNE